MTKAKIYKHLKEVGYDEKSRYKIFGFLVGKGFHDYNNPIAIKVGDKTFEDFMDWYDCESITHIIIVYED